MVPVVVVQAMLERVFGSVYLPEVQGVVEQVDLCIGSWLNCTLDDGQYEVMEWYRSSLHGSHKTREDSQDGLLHEMFFSRLLPKARQNANDRLCIRCNLFSSSVS